MHLTKPSLTPWGAQGKFEYDVSPHSPPPPPPPQAHLPVTLPVTIRPVIYKGWGKGAGHPDPEIRVGGAVSKKIFFGPLGLSLVGPLPRIRD